MTNEFKIPKIPVKPTQTKKKLGVMSNIEPNKFEGVIEPIIDSKPFYMVVVEDSPHPPKAKHETYDQAFMECLRLSKKENKKAFILKSVTQVEQIPSVVQFKQIKADNMNNKLYFETGSSILKDKNNKPDVKRFIERIHYESMCSIGDWATEKELELMMKNHIEIGEHEIAAGLKMTLEKLQS